MISIFTSATVIILYWELLVRFFSGAILFDNLLNLFISSIFFAYIISLISNIFHNKRAIINIFLLIISLLFMLQLFTKLYFTNFMTFNFMATNALNVTKNYTGIIVDIIKSNYVKIALFLLPIVIFNILYKLIVKTYGEKKSLNNKKLILISALFTLIVAVLMFVNIFIISIQNSNFLFFEFNNGVNSYGLINATIIENIKPQETSFLNNDEPKSKSENETMYPSSEYNALGIDFEVLNEETNPDKAINDLNSYYKTIVPSQKNKFTGLFKGKNLIMICAESLAYPVIDEILTPTLYRLVNNGFNFENYYRTNTTRGTGGGESEFITGLMAASDTNLISKNLDGNYNFTIAKQLKSQGYNLFSFHNGTDTYYSRNISHKNLFDNFYAFGNGFENYATTRYDDIPLFEKSFDIYKNQAPFFVHYMTYSGHLPYTSANLSDLNEVKAHYGEKYDKPTNVYLAKQLHFEKGIKILIERLEENNLLNSTVICITSDHFPYALNPSYLSEQEASGNSLESLFQMQFNSENEYKMYKNVLIIWSGALENELKDYKTNIPQVTCTIDLAPTLQNLFGINFDSRFFPGQDVFSSSFGFVPCNNNSFITDNIFYNGQKECAYSIDNRPIDDNLLTYYKTLALNKKAQSINFSSSNYYDYIEEYMNKNNIHVKLNYPGYIFKNKTDLFQKFFSYFYDYLINILGADEYLKQISINNLSDFYSFVSRWDGGAQGMPQVGDYLGTFFAKADPKGNIKNQDPDKTFVGYCIQNNKFVDILDFFTKWFYHFRKDEGLCDPESADAYKFLDFLSYPHDTIIDIAKFFYFDKDTTLPKFFFTKNNVPPMYDQVPGMIYNVDDTSDFCLNQANQYKKLPVLNCYGYKFEGWFDNENFNGKPITEIYYSDFHNQKEINLYPKLKKITN